HAGTARRALGRARVKLESAERVAKTPLRRLRCPWHKALTGILGRDADSYTRSGPHWLRAGPRQLPAGGKDGARLRRPDLDHPVLGLGVGSGARGFRRAASSVGGIARHFFRTSGARRLRPPPRKLPAIAGTGHGNVVPLSERGC